MSARRGWTGRPAWPPVRTVATVLGVLVIQGCAGGPDVATVTETSVVTSIAVATSTVTATQVTTSTVVTTVLRTAPDPDTPGPVGGAVCTPDPSYVDEPTDGLDPTVVSAWAQAVAAAAAQGVVLCLNDGKRSAGQQRQTYDDYVAQYGQAAADTLVLPPERSAHVIGYAVDVQPAASAAWLQATDGFLRVVPDLRQRSLALRVRGELPAGLPATARTTSALMRLPSAAAPDAPGPGSRLRLPGPRGRGRP